MAAPGPAECLALAAAALFAAMLYMAIRAASRAPCRNATAVSRWIRAAYATACPLAIISAVLSPHAGSPLAVASAAAAGAAMAAALCAPRSRYERFACSVRP